MFTIENADEHEKKEEQKMMAMIASVSRVRASPVKSYYT